MKKTVLTIILTLCTALVALAFSVQADTALQLSVAAQGGDFSTVESAFVPWKKWQNKGN